VEKSTPGQLLTFDSFRQLCELQSKVEQLPEYDSYCPDDCLCRSFSLVNYLSFLINENACADVTTEKLATVLTLVENCSASYRNIKSDCWNVDGYFALQRCLVSPQCENATIYQLYYYLVDNKFDTDGQIKFTTSFLHIAMGQASYPLYEVLHRDTHNFHTENIKVVAMNFGLKELVFEKLLIRDTVWVCVSIVVVFMIMWIYTDSFFVTSMTLLSMVFTIIISFTIYQFVFRISYFPFMNLLGAVVVIGIGADDLFVYWKTWMAIKHGKNASILERIVTHTFKHASAAMFVTSASTMTAFYASVYTDLVTVRCFCIYAGTCVIVHYLLMISWLPACVVLYEKHALQLCTSHKRTRLCEIIVSSQKSINTAAQKVLERITRISLLALVWLPLLTLLSVAGALSIFVWPGFPLPSVEMFQMLSRNHPFEVYDRQARSRFDSASQSDPLPLTFIWGVDSTFNGQYFNLRSHGELNLRPIPDLSNPDVQRWFRTFCYELRRQPYFNKDLAQPSGCFIEEFRLWMKRPCQRLETPSRCCNHSFPFTAETFSQCISAWATEVHNFKRYPTDPGLRFVNGEPRVVIISFWTNQKFTYDSQQMGQLYKNVTQFAMAQAEKCPEGPAGLPLYTLSSGWLFYDTQQTLVTSLPLSLAVVLGASTAIIFLTTLNALLTACALVTISCSIATTLGILAAMGWELNVLESVIISLSVGLSMDYPLHVAVAYQIAHSINDRKNRIGMSISHVGGSISAAMLTTLVAGLCVLPAHVIAYKKLGTFLAIVTLVSWLYSLFFMPSLLLYCGPIGTFSQLSCRCQKRRRPLRHLDKTIYSDEISSDAITAAAQTLTSHVIADSLAYDDDDNSAMTPHRTDESTRLSTIAELSIDSETDTQF